MAALGLQCLASTHSSMFWLYLSSPVHALQEPDGLPSGLPLWRWFFKSLSWTIVSRVLEPTYHHGQHPACKYSICIQLPAPSLLSSLPAASAVVLWCSGLCPAGPHSYQHLMTSSELTKQHQIKSCETNFHRATLIHITLCVIVYADIEKMT